MSDLPARILLVDDNQAIHEDYRKILAPGDSRAELAAMESDLFDEPQPAGGASFALTFALQGLDAIREVELARASGKPFSVAFVDIRMPPGLDGVETTARLWEIEPDLQIVLCSAYSDYSFPDLLQRLGVTDRLLILKKPFENVEVMQAALSLVQKWNLLQASRQKIERLDAAVEARTRALEETHRKLYEASKLEAVGRLANGMAHEVNNPLAVTVAALEYIKEELATVLQTVPTDGVTSAMEACGDALVATQRIVNIIHAVRGFARTQGGESRSLSLAELATGHLQEAGKGLPAGVSLVLDLRPTPPVMGPSEALENALAILLSNALLARPPAAGSYPVQVSTGVDQKGWPYLEVRDPGVGIPAVNLPKLFEPFFTTRPVGQGVGLGLCATHGLVTRLGGAVQIDTAPERGTRVRLSLPPAPERAGA